jgi:hypothetical protein
VLPRGEAQARVQGVHLTSGMSERIRHAARAVSSQTLVLLVACPRGAAADAPSSMLTVAGHSNAPALTEALVVVGGALLARRVGQPLLGHGALEGVSLALVDRCGLCG